MKETHLWFRTAQDKPVQPVMKTPSNSRRESSVLAAIQAPQVEVRDHDGCLVARIEQAQASALLKQGWAEPVGNRTMKCLRLTSKAQRTRRKIVTKTCWHHKTTQPTRGDQTCKIFGDGQLMGGLEHKPVSDPILYQAWRTALRPK